MEKSGYLLMKRGRKSSGLSNAWKRRYFVLSERLVCYESHKATSPGDTTSLVLLIDKELVVASADELKYPHCFEIRSGFEMVRVAAECEKEMSEWKRALHEAACRRLEGCSTSFADVDERGRRYLVLDSKSLTFYKDPMSTVAEGTIEMSHESTLVERRESTVSVREGSDDRITLRFPNIAQALGWHGALLRAIEVSKRKTNNDSILNGRLFTLAGSSWTMQTLRYSVGPSALYQIDDSTKMPSAVILIDPTCTVFETTLKQYAFELVTSSQGVLHLQAETEEDRKLWTGTLRKCIADSTFLTVDPIRDLVLDRVLLDLGDVTFLENSQGLGLILERTAEWAVVKASRENETIEPGSVVAAVDGQSCLLTSYKDTIDMLSGWTPPLTITFVKPPRLSGWLRKKMIGGNNSDTGHWRRRFFELGAGKLAYYDRDVTETTHDGCQGIEFAHHKQTLLRFFQSRSRVPFTSWAAPCRKSYHAVSSLTYSQQALAEFHRKRRSGFLCPSDLR